MIRFVWKVKRKREMQNAKKNQTRKFALEEDELCGKVKRRLKGIEQKLKHAFAVMMSYSTKSFFTIQKMHFCGFYTCCNEKKYRTTC